METCARKRRVSRCGVQYSTISHFHAGCVFCRNWRPNTRTYHQFHNWIDWDGSFFVCAFRSRLCGEKIENMKMVGNSRQNHILATLPFIVVIHFKYFSLWFFCSLSISMYGIYLGNYAHQLSILQWTKSYSPVLLWTNKNIAGNSERQYLHWTMRSESFRLLLPVLNVIY